FGKLIITATHSLGYLTIKELSFKIYDKDLITYQMTSDWLNVLSIYSKGEEFNLKAFDAFGEPITMIELIRTDLEPLLGGVTTNVSYKVTDVAGNEVIIPIINSIKLYDLPT